MIIKHCLLINNDCYRKYTRMSAAPQGIVVHSTGCNNPYLKRYVQPVKSQLCYETVIGDLGKNPNDNDWNRSGFKKCVHGFIGYNKKGAIETYQTLPYDICCWGCGSGSKGSYNNNPQAYIQFEICENDLTDKKYFDKVMTEAAEFCAYLIGSYNIDLSKVVSHHEAHLLGYASNHADIDHWLKVHDKNMDWFRSEVKKRLKAARYVVQVGSFAEKQNAEKLLNDLKRSGFNGYIIEKEV